MSILRVDQIQHSNGTAALTIDSSGRVFTTNRPHISGSPTNTTGAGIFNSFFVYSSRELSFSSDRITVPITGTYLISFNTIMDLSAIRRDTRISVNGLTIAQGLSEDSTSGFHYRGTTITRILQANDYVQFYSDDWYNSTGINDVWRTASIDFLG
jgi:hypothetical protein